MSTTSDLALLRRKLAASDYSPDLYVKEIANRCVGGHELHLQRKNIQTLSEDTHSQLKKNVYENYGQFMTTAKEIAFLESEMYQLSHMITDQRNILQEMAETSMLGDKVPLTHEVGEPEKQPDESLKAIQEEKKNQRNEFDDGRRRLYDLLERVEGCSHVTDVPTRFLLHDGDLVEMDIAENSALHRVHGYLMNDGFMVATWLPNRRGPVRFKYSCLYELDSLAIVNVRDLGGIKHAFKLLVFPDARLFQCANAVAKQEWMDSFESAKKRRQKEQETAALKRSDTITRGQRERITARRRKQLQYAAMKGGESTESSKNPFGEEEEDKHLATAAEEDEDEDDLSESKDYGDEFELPEWLIELSEDLEVFIAQREFEQAVELIFRAQSFCSSHSNSQPLAREAKSKLDQRRRTLIAVLEAELGTSVQGGPRAARRAVMLLGRLGRSSQACRLFLVHRAAILQATLKAVKLESATVPYVQRLATTFFSSVLETSTEFRRAFANLPGKTSSFLTWLDEEIDRFCDRIEKQIFSPSTPLEVIAACVCFVREQSCRIQENGLDVTYLVDSRFRRNVERTICEHRDKHVEAVKLRAQEDRWEPINCFNRAGTDRFLEEMASAGILSVRAYVFDECWVALTRNTTSFSLSYLGFADSLLKLFNPALRALINESLVTVFHSHLRHIEQAVRSDKLRNTDQTFLQRNCAFLLDTLLSLIEVKYGERTKSDCPKLGKLHSSYKWLKEGPKATAGPSAVEAGPENTTKYTDPNYL